MKRSTKLELTWIGKENRPKLEPRILLENHEKSYHAKQRVSDDDIFDNRLIFGDNLLALKALEQEFTGKIKCIYIDPPYNTGSAWEYYDDGIEHSIWLSLMRDRLELLWRLLISNGFMAVQIDDNEFARLYLLLSEICGEKNLKVIVVKMAEPTGVKMAHVRNAGTIAKLKEYIILCGKDGIRGLDVPDIPKPDWDNEYNRVILGLDRQELDRIRFLLNSEGVNNINEIDQIACKIVIATVNEVSHVETNSSATDEWRKENSWRIIRTCATTGVAKKLADEKRLSIPKEAGAFAIITPRGKQYLMLREYDATSPQPRIKILFANDYLTYHPGDFWNDIKTTGLGREGGVDFTNGKKPEALIKRIIQMTTKHGDWVLDSFAGSGTTGAVAHKMGRRWIMVELEETCHTHIIPRLKQVMDGKDAGGITKAVGWKGGGGFRYYCLAPSLLEKDVWGNWVIRKEYNPAMLAEAMCKHEGFTYAPSEEMYWQHGHSSETDFIYVTTQTLNRQQLTALSDEVGPKRTLLICCSAFRVKPDAFPNLTLKKIPKAVLRNCEWDRDDYSLEVSALPPAPTEEEEAAKRIDELPLFAKEKPE